VLKIDGLVQDMTVLSSNQPLWYTLSANLTPGTHQLAVAFDNDAYAPPEDRNLFLDRIRWGRDSDTNPATLLTRPGAVVQMRLGNGLIVLDEINWDIETQNLTKANRFASTLLTGLGAEMPLRSTIGIEAEGMTNINVNAYTVSGGLAHLNSNGRIQTAVNVTSAGSYQFELWVGGTAAQGVLPQVGIVIDGVMRTNFFLSTTNVIRYSMTLDLSAGTHAIGLAFLNDFYAAPEDRNAFFDRIEISAGSTLRITQLSVDRFQQSATVQWESLPGSACDVEFATNLFQAVWTTAATVTNDSSVAAWQDTGNGNGSRPPPLSSAAPQRFYRIRQIAP
jgi:hypothetical protein